MIVTERELTKTVMKIKVKANLVAVIKRKGCEFTAPAPAHGVVSLDHVLETNHTVNKY